MKARLKNIWLKIRENKWEVMLVLGLLAIAGITHGWNMFHYPYYENDEATYVSQAWSVVTQGKLAPYTYWYDHAPGGWIFIALWQCVTFGGHLFGSLLNSGRILMLLLHIGSALLVYLITRRLTNNKLAASVAVIIFSLSPLGLYFQRRVLLDNIMIFWVLLSVWLLLKPALRIRYVVLSAIAFGIAVVTKENAIFFLPAYVLLLFSVSHKRHKKHAVFMWLIVALSVISLYALYALLKGEFFPATSTTNGIPSHVSLLGALEQQNGRGVFSWPWERYSQFYTNTKEWLSRDPFIIIGGFVALLFTLTISVVRRKLNIIAIMALLMLLFLARGKLVIDFYIIPMLPLLAILIACSVAVVANWIRSRKILYAYGAAILVIIIGIYSNLTLKQYYVDETRNQVAAVQWVEKNLPTDTSIAIDDYMYPFLQDQNDYKNADWFFKMQLDPSINKKYRNDYKNIQYLVLSNQIVQAFRYNEVPLVQDVYEHSTLVADFTDGTTSYNDLDKFISTNGDWAQIYKLKTPREIILQDSWDTYKSTYIKSYGQVVDKDTTTSEGQAYAMLRAVQEGDKSTFGGVYQWTQDHMQHRPEDKLFSWKWQRINGVWQQTDSNTATDADQDIVYALLQAYDKWHDTKYLDEARTILAGIWGKEVTQRNNLYYLLPSAAGPLQNGNILYNPSYVSPSYYRAFATADPAHPWNALADDSYQLLNAVQNKTTGLFPDWIEFDAAGDQVALTAPGLTNTHGYDAFRTGYRLSLDSADPRAKAILKPLSDFYVAEWRRQGMINAVYAPGGTAAVPYGDLAQYGAILNVLKATGQQAVAKEIYSQQIRTKYRNGSWGDAKNYYNQNWVWLGIATYGEGLPVK